MNDEVALTVRLSLKMAVYCLMAGVAVAILLMTAGAGVSKSVPALFYPVEGYWLWCVGHAIFRQYVNVPR